MPAKIVLDSNALLMPFESGVRIEAELERLFGSYEAIVPEAVLQELAELAAQGKGQRATNARMALTLASRFSYRKSTGRGDDAIFRVAQGEQAILFTNDKGLQARALKAGLSVVRLKGHGHLILETRQGEAR